jgi:hypothetical protein
MTDRLDCFVAQRKTSVGESALFLQGAMPTPQLPITTVVTPCHDEGPTEGSQQICAS